MVAVLVILDGASEPLGPGSEPTSLELARTPTLDRLACEGSLTRLRTVAVGLPPGSEAAIPALLGWVPPAPVDRGALEAAAYGIVVAEGERAWRVDVTRQSDAGAGGRVDGARPWAVCGVPAGTGGCVDGARPDAATVVRAVAMLRAGAPCHEVHVLRGHRLLLVGPAAIGVCRVCLPEPDQLDTPPLRVWPEGVVPPRILGPDTVVVGARGAAIGAARLMGAATVVPAGATGQPESDLAAKAAAAIRAIAGGAARVVVHVGGPDEAAHLRDRAAKVAAIECADRDLLAPLADAARRFGAALRVCPDHGCDPRTGEHDAVPVPCVAWAPRDGALARELERVLAPCAAAPAHRSRRLTERAVAHLPVVKLATAAAALGAAA